MLRHAQHHDSVKSFEFDLWSKGEEEEIKE